MYVPALKGIADTYLDVAICDINTEKYGSSASALKMAFDYGVKALEIVGNSYCLYKLIGDVCNVASQVSALSFKSEKSDTSTAAVRINH